MRLLSLNPNVFRPENTVKLENMIKSCREREIDGIFLCETNCRYYSLSINNMARYFKRLNLNVVTHTLDSGDNLNVKTN